MRLRRLLFGSLATMLLWQTLLLSLLPMMLTAITALYMSAALMRGQLSQQGKYVAGRVTSDIRQQGVAASQTAALVAVSPTLRALAEAGDRGALTSFLQSMQQQLDVDGLDVADASGTVTASTAAATVGQELPESLLRHVSAGPGAAWVLAAGPQGPTLYAVAPITGAGGAMEGLFAVQVLVGPSFLRSERIGVPAELALSFGNEVQAATIAPRDGPSNVMRAAAVSITGGGARVVTFAGRRYLLTRATVESNGGEPAALSVLSALAPVDAMTHAIWVLLSTLGLTLCVVVVLLTWRMARGIVAPFQQLVTAALRIQSGDLGARVQPKAQHEIRVLEVAFNTMIESLGERERERASHEAELLHLASHDPLTGLPNRSLLERALNEAVAEAGQGRPSTLLYIDLDQFKIVNDTLGHGSGDRLLITLAGLVRTTLRDGDILARLGGDEFAALLRGLRVEDAIGVAERVRRVVDDYRYVDGGQDFSLGASIGVTGITGTVSASEVLGQADIACYTAKSEGRNRVAIYEPEAATLALLSGDGRWTVELKDALIEDRLRLVFQPVVRLNGQGVSHYETLLRLVDREGHLVGPAAFIPAAERSGLIREIDHWVLNAALERMWQETTRGNRIRLAINLSGITLGSAESAEFIRHAIEAKGVDPTALIFEITETALMTNLTRAQQTMDGLKAIGCHFALDDFGSGFSSFTYLAHLPVESVKIDGSFIRDLATNSVNQAIVRAIANVTRSMGKESVAEWVEDAATVTALRRLHVDLAQGHFIGQPSAQIVPSPELVAAGD